MPPFVSKSEPHAGPYEVAGLVHEGAKACDPTVESEVPGLVPGIDLRPPDVRTSAPSSHLIALDVSVSPPRLGRWCGLQQHHRGHQTHP